MTEGDRRLRIVGVGASAGGLESLERLFRNIPRTGVYAFVVIQHLSPDFKSMMDELLARYTDLDVVRSEDGMQVEADHVYLLSPRKEIEIRNGRLVVVDKPASSGLTFPVDRFFTSLAEEAGDDAIAITLSGSGSDGAAGAKRVHEAGGLVFAEAPESAAFDGMPLATIGTGYADVVSPPEQLAQALLDMLSGDSPVGSKSGVDRVLSLLRRRHAVDFSDYKRNTVFRRLQRRVELHRMADVSDYVARLESDPEELEALCWDLLIGVTSFNRDPACFEVLDQEILPAMVEEFPDRELRIWVAGCASGEEAYSLAIAAAEARRKANQPPELRVFATDIHQPALDAASAGIYDKTRIERLPAEIRERYFERVSEDTYRIVREIRDRIVFVRHNVLRDAPFTNLDLVSCRNLLIYLRPRAQRRALSLMHYGLRVGGVMFLGSSETPGSLLDDYEVLRERCKLYRKLRRGTNFPYRFEVPEKARVDLGSSVRVSQRDMPLLNVYDALLDEVMSPGFLIDSERKLIDSFGGAERLLQMQRRRTTTELTELVPERVRVPLAGALSRAARDGGPVRYASLEWPTASGTTELFVLEVRSFVPARSRDPYFVVTLTAPATGDSETRDVELGDLSRERFSALEHDLAETRESLQATVEEVEASNEELQATNEELIASNEELQSTNEELHSVNEELHTVNAEYQRKIEQLSILNADFRHLLEAMDVATIFLDPQLRIRKYTPRAAPLFNLVEHDIGRPLGAFSHTLDYPGLMSDIHNVLETGEPIEREVRDRRGGVVFVRLLCYRREQVVEGVVVTVIDMSALAAERARAERLMALVESSDEAIIGYELDGTVTTWNQGARRLFGYAADEIVGENVSMIVPEDRREELERGLREIAGGARSVRLETVRRAMSGELIDVEVVMSAVVNSAGAVIGVSAIDRDIRERLSMIRRLARSERIYQDLYDNAPDMYVSHDVQTGAVVSCNARFVEVTGYSRAEAEVLGLADLYAPRALESARRCLDKVRKGDDVYGVELVIVTKSGEEIEVELNAGGIADDHGRVIRTRSVLRDIRERRRVEELARQSAALQDRFLRMVAHELRNPLHTLGAAVDLLQQDDLGDDVVARLRRSSTEQISHMARLVEDILDVSRADDEKMELRLKHLDLMSLVRDVVASFIPRFDEVDVELALSGIDREIPVTGDSDRIRQIISNLLSNARRFSTAGQQVLVEVACDGDTAEISVSDHGKGIPKEELDRIFELFYQVEPGLARTAGGLGIGLHLSRRLAVAHGGTITADSDGANKGATFTLRLPISAAPPAQLAPRDGAGREPARVVLIDDQQDIVDLLSIALKHDGHDVHTAMDGETGVDLIRSVSPRIAFVDIGLPGIDGFEVARRLRADGPRPLILIAVTGYGQADDRKMAAEAGFDRLLVKPLSAATLRRVIDDDTAP